MDFEETGRSIGDMIDEINRESEKQYSNLNLTPYFSRGAEKSQIKFVTNTHKKIAHLFINGFSHKQIAKVLSIPEQKVGLVLNDPKIKPALEQAEWFAQQEISMLIPQAIKCVREMLQDDQPTSTKDKGIKNFKELYSLFNRDERPTVSVNVNTGAREKMLEELKNDPDVVDALQVEEGEGESGSSGG